MFTSSILNIGFVFRELKFKSSEKDNKWNALKSVASYIRIQTTKASM